MIKGHKIAVGLGLALVIAATDWAILHRDWFPLLWHLKHGRHFESNDIRFTVPLFYQEDHGTLANTAAFFQFPGHFSKKTSAITIQFNRRKPVPSIEDSFSRSERSTQFAGKPGTCIEFVEKRMRRISFNNMELEFPASDASTYIYCNFSTDISASFCGDFAAKNDFYAFLAEAEPVTRE